MSPTITNSPAAVEVGCSHCGLPVTASLLDEECEEQFCCNGCRTVWELLHDRGLSGYYSLGEKRQIQVTPSHRGFEEFGHPSFLKLYARERADGLRETELYLEGVHCSACVWLVERLPLTIPGVVRAELEVSRSLAHLVWDPKTTGLPEIARFLDTLGYRPHPFRGIRTDQLRRQEDRRMILRIGVAGALAGNVMLLALAMYSGMFSGMEASFERYFRWLSLILTAPALLGPGSVFFRGAYAALRTRSLHIDLPIGIALGIGFGRGLWNTAVDSGPVYFDGVATLVFLLLVGRFLQQRAQRTAADSALLLHSLAPSAVRVISDTGTQEIPTEALLPGMVIEIRPGEIIAADGMVRSGASEVNLALLTGESVPGMVQSGSEVWAGTTNLTHAIEVMVTQSGEASRLGKLLREVETAAGRRGKVVEAANRIAGWFVAVVMTLAAATLLLWWPVDPTAATDHAIALLIVTCPCALALATPLAMSVAIGRAARRGILIKGGAALESLGGPQGTIYLDKTGTITTGNVELVSWRGPDQIRRLVLALERDAVHPVAAAMRRGWPEVQPGIATAVRHEIGGGVTGMVEGRQVIVGSPNFVASKGVVVPPLELAESLSPVVVAVDGAVAGVAGFGDPVRPEAAEVLRALRQGGWRLKILSGDSDTVVRDVGRALGFAEGEFLAEASPERKLAIIDATDPRPVVMVGDGVNDAAAMAAAEVGVGVKGGAEACLAAADIYLSQPGLLPLRELLIGSRRTLKVVRRNMLFSLGYNVVGAGLALAGILDPLIAAILMPLSSITVISHSWLSKTFTEATR